jgi:Ca2+/Na+ antiporter
MLEFISFLFSVIATFVILFCVIFVFLFFRNLRKIQEESQMIAENEEAGKSVMLVYYEKVDNMLHMYDRLTNYFVAHGKDENEMWERAQLRYPEVSLVLSDESTSNLAVVTQRIKKQ